VNTPSTKTFQRPRRSLTRQTHRALLTVVDGPNAGKHLSVAAEPCVLGTSAECDLVLDDPMVSRRHIEVQWNGHWLHAVDRESKNGSFYGDSRFQELELGPGQRFRIGETEISVTPEVEEIAPAPDADSRLGQLLGTSTEMRQVFALMRQVADVKAPVLITGETGVGKELFAHELHRTSSRRNQRFVIVDCGAVPPELIESVLFGHVRGAFSGADADRRGLLEEADGGTLFLDEIGELPVELQPRLLRVLDRGMVRRVGSNRYQRVDVRVVSATHRDLRTMMLAGDFREDLYYRMSVIRIEVPPLRDRLEDLSHLAADLLLARGLPHVVVTPDALELLSRYRWPGNVRELGNVLDACLALAGGDVIDAAALERTGFSDVLADPLEAGGASTKAVAVERREQRQPFAKAKAQLVAEFERRYLGDLVDEYGSITAAARGASMDRKQLRGLLHRYDLSFSNKKSS